MTHPNSASPSGGGEPCKHTRVWRGPDVPRHYGTWQSRVCLDCWHWHTVDHHGRQPGAWQPPQQLVESLLHEEEA